jgi:hypothetical protein
VQTKEQREQRPEALMILVARPYRSGTDDDPRAHRAQCRSDRYRLAPVSRGSSTGIGEWFARPVIEHAGSTGIGDAVFDEIFHPIARRSVQKCNAWLRIGRPSKRRRRHGRGEIV